MNTNLGGLVLHLWVIAGCSLIIAALLTSFFRGYLLSILSCFGPIARQRFIWCIAGLPWLLAVFAALITLVPSLMHILGLTLDHCHSHGNLHDHLCWSHPPEFVWNSWKGTLAILFIFIVVWKIISIIHRLYQQQLQLRMLLAFATKNNNGDYILESKIPSAFTAGLITPKILLSRALVVALTDEELGIVQQHEAIHQRRYDPLKLWIFINLTSVLLPSARRDLLKGLELNMEQIVDAEVATHSDPVFVASTLIKVNRLTLRYFKSADSVICSFSATAIEERVQQLLNLDKGRHFPWGSFLLSLVSLLALAIYFAEDLHHLVETFLHHSA